MTTISRVVRDIFEEESDRYKHHLAVLMLHSPRLVSNRQSMDHYLEFDEISGYLLDTTPEADVIQKALSSQTAVRTLATNDNFAVFADDVGTVWCADPSWAPLPSLISKVLWKYEATERVQRIGIMREEIMVICQRQIHFLSFDGKCNQVIQNPDYAKLMELQFFFGDQEQLP